MLVEVDNNRHLLLHTRRPSGAHNCKPKAAASHPLSFDMHVTTVLTCWKHGPCQEQRSRAACRKQRMSLLDKPTLIVI